MKKETSSNPPRGSDSECNFNGSFLKSFNIDKMR